MEFSILVLSLLALVMFALCCLLFFKNTGLSGAVLGARAELDAIKTQGKTLADRAEKLEDEKANLSAQNRSLERELATLRERERALNEKFGEFSSFSAKIFEEARGKFESSNKSQMDSLLAPLKEDIKRFAGRIEEMNAESERKRGNLEAQIGALKELNTTLGKEARGLAEALKGQNKYAGSWGEMVLQRLLEACGLLEGVTYLREDSHTQEGNRLRPDFVVKLPENRNIIIDSKVSLVPYERFVSSEEQAQKTSALRQFLESVRSHIKGLSKKKYENIAELANPDFVIMFMPIESAFCLAISADSDLLDFAAQNKVILASPSTMFSILKTVETIWRTERQTANTLEIARQGGALYDKVAVFVSKFEKIGKSIDALKRDYDDSLSTLSSGRGNVLRSAEKLRQLGANIKKPMESKLLENLENE